MRVTKQSLFDATWQHHIIRDEPYGYSYETNECVYGNEKGAQCAIGCNFLLQDAIQLENILMEGLEDDEIEETSLISLFGLEADYPESVKTFIKSIEQDVELYNFAKKLQSTHDQCAYREEQKGTYREKLMTIAKEHNLEIKDSVD